MLKGAHFESDLRFRLHARMSHRAQVDETIGSFAPVSAEQNSAHRTRSADRQTAWSGAGRACLSGLSARAEAVNTVPKRRRFGAWLAVASLLLQIAFATGHSARHFDHLVGAIDRTGNGLGVDTSKGAPASPGPASPVGRDLDHCAVGLGLAATASAILANAEPLPLSPGFLLARPQGLALATTRPPTRHFLPLARAPPAFEISA